MSDGGDEERSAQTARPGLTSKKGNGRRRTKNLDPTTGRGLTRATSRKWEESEHAFKSYRLSALPAHHGGRLFGLHFSFRSTGRAIPARNAMDRPADQRCGRDDACRTQAKARELAEWCASRVLSALGYGQRHLVIGRGQNRTGDALSQRIWRARGFSPHHGIV